MFLTILLSVATAPLSLALFHQASYDRLSPHFLELVLDLGAL
jgi:hypothetical protein